MFFFKKKQEELPESLPDESFENTYTDEEMSKWTNIVNKIKAMPITMDELERAKMYFKNVKEIDLRIYNNVYKYILESDEVIASIGQLVDGELFKIQAHYDIPNAMLEDYYDYVGSSISSGFKGSNTGNIMRISTYMIGLRISILFNLDNICFTEEVAYKDASDNFDNTNFITPEEGKAFEELNKANYTAFGIIKNNTMKAKAFASLLGRATGSLVKNYGTAIAKDAIRMVKNSKDDFIEMYFILETRKWELDFSKAVALEKNGYLAKEKLRKNSIYNTIPCLVRINEIISNPVEYIGKIIECKFEYIHEFIKDGAERITVDSLDFNIKNALTYSNVALCYPSYQKEEDKNVLITSFYDFNDKHKLNESKKLTGIFIGIAEHIDRHDKKTKGAVIVRTV